MSQLMGACAAELLKPCRAPFRRSPLAAAAASCRRGAASAGSRFGASAATRPPRNPIFGALVRDPPWPEALAVLEDTFRSADFAGGSLGLEAGEASKACSMVAALGARQRRWELALHLLDRMPSEYGVRLNARYFGVAVASCADVSQWAVALSLLVSSCASTLQPSLMCINKVLVSLARASRWVLAAALAESMQERMQTSPDLFTLAAVLQAHAGARLWRESLRWLQWGLSSRLRPDLVCYNVAAATCARAGEWEAALVLLEDVRANRLQPDVVTWGSIVGVPGRWELSMALLEGAWRSGVVLNPQTFGISLVGCKDSNLWRGALALVQQARAYRVPLDALALNSALASCELGAAWASALALLRFAQDAEGGPAASDVTSWNTTMAACRSAHEWRRAIALLLSLWRPEFLAALGMPTKEPRAAPPRPQPDTVSFNTGIAACADARLPGSWRTALALLGAMPWHAVKADGITYLSVISTMERAGMWQHAVSIVSGCQHNAELVAELRGGHYGAAAVACIRGSAWAMGLSLLADMRRAQVVLRGAEDGAYLQVVHAAQLSAQWRWATELYMEALRLRLVGPSSSSTRLE